MKYRVLVGMNYAVNGEDVRREPDDVIDDLPKSAPIKSLLEQGVIEEVNDAIRPRQ